MAEVEILVYAAEKEIWDKVTESGDTRFRFRAIDDYEQLRENIRENPFHVILASKEKFKNEPEFAALVRQKEYLFIIYCSSFDAESKSEFLADGVWFCWNVGDGITPLSRKLDLVLKRKNLIAKHEKINDGHGNLNDLPFDDLLVSFISLKKNVKLELYSSYGKVELFFKDGKLLHARHGRLIGNEAVLNIFLWRTGTYFFKALEEEEIPVTVNASAIALIAEGARRKDYFWNHWAKKYNVRSPLVFLDKERENLDPHLQSIEKLINGHNPLLQILLSGEIDYPILLNHIEKLLDEGVIAFSEAVNSVDVGAGTGRSFFSRGEAIALEQVLFMTKQNLEAGVFLVAGMEKESILQVIKTLNGKENPLIKNINDTFVSEITLHEKKLNLTGILVDDRFIDKIQELSEQLVGLLFLIDARAESSMEYSSYVINFLLSNFSGLIYALGLAHLEKARALPLNIVLTKLKLPDYVTVVNTNIEKEDSIRELIFSLKEVPDRSGGGENA